MNEQDIVKAAKEAGFYFHTIPDYAPTQHTLPREYSEKCFHRFAEAIRNQTLAEVARHFDEKAAKMEETARILEVEGSDDVAVHEYMEYAADYLAAASMVSAFSKSAI